MLWCTFLHVLLGVYWTSWMCRLNDCTKFGKFELIFPQIFFLPHPFLISFIAEWHLEIRACALWVLIGYWDVIVSRPSQWLGHTCKRILTMQAHISISCLFSFFHLSFFFFPFLSFCHLSIYLSSHELLLNLWF